MSEDQVATEPDRDDEEAIAPVAHDDIMKRLLDYQRQLREGAQEPAPIAAEAAFDAPTALATDELVDLTADESLAVDAAGDVVDLSTTTEDDVVDLPETDATIVIEPAVAAIGSDDGGTGDEADGSGDAVDAEANAMAMSDEGPEAFDGNGAGSSVDAVTELETPSEHDLTMATADGDLRARLERLERTLDRLSGQLGEVRQSFQDLSIAADEKIASLEDEIAEARGSLDG